MKVTKRTTVVVGAVAVAAAVVSVGGIVTRAGADQPAAGTSLNASNLSALQDGNTAIAGVPSEARGFGALEPAPGTAHTLGNGAVAWVVAGGRICWVAKGAGGCVGQLSQPLVWTIRDPDEAGSGTPPSIFGLAVDDLQTVTVALGDGQTVTAHPADNFYSVVLPSGMVSEDVTRITATMADGTVFGSPATLGL